MSEHDMLLLSFFLNFLYFKLRYHDEETVKALLGLRVELYLTNHLKSLFGGLEHTG